MTVLFRFDVTGMKVLRQPATLAISLVVTVVSACDATRAAPIHADQDGQLISTNQRWSASNEQSKLIAGNLTVGQSAGASDTLTFAFANGVTLETRHALLPADDADVRALVDHVQTELGAPAGAFPAFYEVLEERVATSAPQGGLCGGQRTRFLAAAEFVDAAGVRALRIASFQVPTAGTVTLGAAPDRPRIDPTKLLPCFALDYRSPDAGEP